MSEIEKVIQEIEDMAHHPSMKTDITGHSMAVAIQALQEKAEREKYPNGWIPISKKWPEQKGYYLTTYREWADGNYLPKYDDTYIKILRCDKAVFRLPVNCDKAAEEDTHREVLAWQPLPKAYEEKE